MPIPTPSAHPPDAELARRFQGGDRQALDALMGRYRRFARSRSRSYFMAGGDADDLEQEALIGVYKAVRDYRPEHEVAFPAFAEVCVTRQLLSAIKAANRHKHRPLNASLSLHARREVGDGDGDGPSLSDQLAGPGVTDDPAERIVGVERLAVLAEAVAGELSGLETEVLGLYVAGRSYGEISIQVGRPAKSVDNAVQRIKRKLGRCLAHYEAATC